MVKPLSLNVSYQDRTRLITCQRDEIPEKIEEFFNINFKDVYLCNKSGNCISNLRAITDPMFIQIKNKVGSRSLRPQNENDSSPSKLVNSIINKLEKNSPLSGQERMSLIEWLKKNSANFSKGREHNGLLHRPEMVNKKLQVDSDLVDRYQENNLEHNGLRHRPEMVNKKLQVDSDQVDSFPKKRKLNEISCNKCQLIEKANKKVQVSSINNKDDSTQTDHLNIALNETSTTDLIDDMKKLASSEMVDDDVAARLMTITFDDRRNFILLKAPPVTLIRDKYPLLFLSKNEVRNELDRIFYAGKCNEFLKNMKEYSTFILKHCKENDEIRLLTEKSMTHARGPKKAYAEVVGSVFALSKLLGEEFRFIHLNDNPHGSKDIYPHIDASGHSLKDIFLDNIKFNIVVEGLHLCKADSFNEAILCLLSSFFIFNIDYPESCKETLTCFEKLYLCANDTLEVDERTLQIVKFFSLQVKESKKHDL